MALVEKDQFKYKFCGTVDDMMLSSHIVRDVGQSATLTPRQAFIREAIRLAWANALVAAPEVCEEILAFRQAAVGDYLSPLPFLAPPIYVHVPLVVEREFQADGSPKLVKLSKRSYDFNASDTDTKRPFFFIKTLKGQKYLPESVISYLLSKIVPPKGGVTASEHRLRMARAAGELGATVLIDAVSSEISLDWLRGARQSVCVSEKMMRSQEREVIRHLHYNQYMNRLNEQCFKQPRKMRADVVLQKLYEARQECCSWREIAAIGTYDAPGRPRPRLLKATDLITQAYFAALRDVNAMAPSVTDSKTLQRLFVQEFRGRLRHSESGQRKSFQQACSVIRQLLTGLDEGMPLLLLGQILGAAAIEELIGSRSSAEI
jgi:hypothetical protein